MNDMEIRERRNTFRQTLDAAVDDSDDPPLDSDDSDEPPLDADFVREFNEFVASYPHVLEWKDKHGRTLLKALFDYLIRALRAMYQLETFRALVIQVPRVLAETDRWGWTLLHRVCYHNPCALDIVSFFVGQFPDAVKMTDGSRQDAPLHNACWHGAPLPVIRVLVQANARAVDSSNLLGYTPLHYACGGGSNLRDVIQYLLAKQPSICFRRNKKGATPLDFVKWAGNRNRHIVEFMTTATEAAANALTEQLCYMGPLPREICEQVATFARGAAPVAEVSTFELAFSRGEAAVLFRRNDVRTKFFTRMHAE